MGRFRYDGMIEMDMEEDGRLRNSLVLYQGFNLQDKGEISTALS